MCRLDVMSFNELFISRRAIKCNKKMQGKEGGGMLTDSQRLCQRLMAAVGNGH